MQDTSIIVDALFKTFAEASSDIIHLNDEDGNLLFANRASEELLGYSEEELLHRPVTFLIHHDDLAMIASDMQSISDSKPYPAREIRLRKKDGSYLEVEVQGFLVPSEQGRFIGAVIRDISRRKALERQKIQFTDSILQSQLATTLDGILVVAPDNTILLSNKRFQEMWRIDPDIAALHDDQKQIESILEQLVDPQAFLDHVLYLYEHPEEKSMEFIHLKDSRIFERYSAPLYNTGPGGEHLGRIWYFRDVSRAKHQEEEMVKMKKLESVGVLAGGIAHDFSNLLSAILGNVELSSFYVERESKAVELLKDAKQACLRAHVLTQQLITFSKGGDPVKEKVSLENIIQECCRRYLSSFSVGYNLTIAENLWPLECDTVQIEQVIKNLLINACEAMSDGGEINISCMNVHHPGNSKLTEGDYLQVTITDHGIGILKRNIGNIFDPYFTTKDMGANKGTGLGLAIAHSILGKHEGSIEVESVEGEGTTFTILLPACKQAE